MRASLIYGIESVRMVNALLTGEVTSNLMIDVELVVRDSTRKR